MIAHIDLQTAVFTSLNLGSYNVFETVPAKTKMPYITIGDATQVNDNTKTSKRKVFNIMMHTWSTGTDSTQSKLMDDFVQEQLLNNDLLLVSHDLDMVELSMSVGQKEITTDKTIFHTSLEFEFHLTEKETIKNGTN